MKKQQGNTALVVIFLIFGIMILAVIGMALNIVTIPWLKLGSQVQMERDIIAKTYDADNALYNYRWFKDRYEAIKATEKKVETAHQVVEDYKELQGDPRDWSFDVQQEYARLNEVARGLDNHYEDLVAEYNSRAKQADRAIFQDELPTFFTLKPF